MPFNRNSSVILIIWAFFFICPFLWSAFPAQAQGPGRPDQGVPVTMAPEAFIYGGEKPGYLLVVEKSSQTALLYRHDGQNLYLEKTMACSTGESHGDKLLEGDKKTPEGFYVFTKKMVKSELSDLYGVLAYPMDYPNFWDKNSGRKGYGIWTHGITKPLQDYDSNGCVELHNLDIIALEPLLNLYDTPILVYEKIIYRPAKEAAAEAEHLRAVVEGWRQAWAGKNLKTYQAHYDRKFINSEGRSFEDWMKHKEHLARTYKKIEVGVRDLRLYRHRDVVVALFGQHYKGDDRFTSQGEKRLYLAGPTGGYKIMAEEFITPPARSPQKWLTAAEKEAAVVASVAQAKAGERPDAVATKPLAIAWATYDQPPDDKAAPTAPAPPVAASPAVSGASEKTDLTASAGATIDLNLVKRVSLADEMPLSASAPEKPAAPAKPAAPTETPPVSEIGPEKAIAALLTDWAGAWQQKNKNSYFAFYDQDFLFKDKNLKLAEFKKHRSRLMDQNSKIEVKVEQLKVTVTKDTAKASFIQSYRADNHRDRGRKILMLKKRATGWKIVEESWSKLK